MKLDTKVLRVKQESSEFCKLVSQKYNTDESDSDIYTKLSLAMETAANERLPVKPKPQPGWFMAAVENLSKLVEERNLAMSS